MSNSLPEFLVHLGLITKEQLNQVRDRITMSTEEDKFVKLLVAYDLITNTQLKEATELFIQMGSKDREKRASAAHEYAQQQTGLVMRAAAKLKVKAGSVTMLTEATKKETGDRYPAVSPILVESSD